MAVFCTPLMGFTSATSILRGRAWCLLGWLTAMCPAVGGNGGQAKVGELEETVAQLTTRIAELMSEKATLDSRVGILNRVLRMREEHIETLQRKGTTTVHCPLAATLLICLLITSPISIYRLLIVLVVSRDCGLPSTACGKLQCW